MVMTNRAATEQCVAAGGGGGGGGGEGMRASPVASAAAAIPSQDRARAPSAQPPPQSKLRVWARGNWPASEFAERKIVFALSGEKEKGSARSRVA